MYTHQSSRYCTITWFARLKRLCIAFLFILFGSISQAYAFALHELVLLPKHHACHVSIISIQSAQTSPDLQISHINNIKSWQTVKLPDFWENRWKNYSGTVWYRILWSKNCPTSQIEPFALNIDSINMAGEVYLNKQLIWRDKNLIEPLSRSWNMPRYWVLPDSELKQGQNEILIRVIGIATQSPGLGKVYIGAPHAIIEQNSKYVFEHRTLYFINLVISLTLGTITFLVWLIRRKDSTFGWFALASLLWGLFISNILTTETYPFFHTLQLAKINMLFLVGYVISFTIYAWRFAGKKYKKIENLLWFISLIGGISLFFVPSIYLGFTLLFLFLFVTLVFLGCCLFYQWIAYKTPKADIRFLALILLGFVGIGLHDVYLILTQNTEQTYITPFAAPLTALAISMILAWRIAQNVNYIEEFNHTLAQTVEHVRADLKNSLDKKHQLEIENMRLQERLNLSHELHDGLGGSLVRSMILVDKSNDMDKQHFLSILKLLRNDLRQVIDSGSTIGAKVPESPIIWASSIRRRFVQLFEELEIESEWHLPDYWLKEPNTLQCLTLARVAEEALTNIIKHSHATLVQVSLSQDYQQLVLEIQDNGIGFDPNMVQEGLHVGLQSMQVRVNRIGGSFEIYSKTGQTLIRVKL
ncbi:histidine kinase [Acinetobacter sp. S40]|uniref:sensor histidine kinase n=1 Tax=Acinetobacter sp. S40 TaxID=2767434 RepID=UPI00190B96A4|nr:ATP-binding protein [Acinetobacter sp. S40]MBJ9984552.1 histidine kinase [Acinetobacter sp. S40]